MQLSVPSSSTTRHSRSAAGLLRDAGCGAVRLQEAVNVSETLLGFTNFDSLTLYKNLL